VIGATSAAGVALKFFCEVANSILAWRVRATSCGILRRHDR
jgi:hypothetical protein